MGRLSFAPESDEQLRARFAEALVGDYNGLTGMDAAGLRPGRQKRHVFDFQDGLRLIVSFDSMGLADRDPAAAEFPGITVPLLHASASARKGSALHQVIVDSIDREASPRLKSFVYLGVIQVRMSEALRCMAGWTVPLAILMITAPPPVLHLRGPSRSEWESRADRLQPLDQYACPGLFHAPGDSIRPA
jgi:hypothetical protein